MAEEKTIDEMRFDAAVKVIQSLPRNGPFQPSNDMMLKFYSYYKQATQGPCKIPRPGFWDPVGKVKWDAWNALGAMPKEKAMIAYVDEMKTILETIPMTEQVMELLDVLGPFYDVVENRVEESNGVSEKADAARGLESSTLPPQKNGPREIENALKVNDSIDASDGSVDSIGSGIVDEDDGDKEMDEESEVLLVRREVEGSTGKPPVSLPNGNVEHSVSSLTNGTHSSLNSDCMEDELACTLEPPEQPCDANGPLSDHVEEVTGLLPLASDSDGEVYCDSMEQFGQEEGSAVLINHSLGSGELSCTSRVGAGISPEVCRRHDRKGGDGSVRHGGEDGASSGPPTQRMRPGTSQHSASLVRRGRGSRASESATGTLGSVPGGGGDGDRRGSKGGVEGTLNEQIATALARLQEDMQSVLQRLQTLEALTASQTRTLSLQQNFGAIPASKKPPWWPFDIPPGAVAFAVVWPFVVHWLVWLYFQRRRRKMN